MISRVEENVTSKKIVAIYGSPRRKGNTATLLKKAIEGARDSGAEVEEMFSIGLQGQQQQRADYFGVGGFPGDTRPAWEASSGASACCRLVGNIRR